MSEERNINELILEDLFNNDLVIDKMKIFNFTTKLEFEFQGLYRKIRKYASDDDNVDSDFIFDKVPFDLCERVSQWMDKNTNIGERLTSGDIIDKTLVFIYLYLDYFEIKKKLKK